MTRVSMNELHAAAHELTVHLHTLGALAQNKSLRVVKNAHMPYLLFAHQGLSERARRVVSDYLSHRTEDGWEIGDTRREALGRLEAVNHVLQACILFHMQ